MINKLKLIGISIFMSQSLCTSYGCDDKTLDIGAGACSTKLWSGIPISRTDIEDSLGFISNLHKIDKKYGQELDFSSFVELSKTKLKDLNYDKFAHDCLMLFNESLNQNKKVAIHILLEKVAKDYGTDLNKSKILKDREEESKTKQEPRPGQDYDTDRFLQEFLNADKAVHSH